eukprot:CAMPEP_0177546056 /NCGR_PEP_ID=MMETSP0369-20130122/62997_1 /TAXON_ID=447022 ORGANISM="Scrippsiella hangoei-like, Strain SHHI-4" /NCGR_SAMPLE_ID=MMETSP0369 /ASSEMBLY_ACC=CAM_ASM_000364 /LENGTH=130 /DNA_ID=CAMNT_0019030489 /DNA_START=245 /DNA_END=637 /DNA_ORIENTATION=+
MPGHPHEMLLAAHHDTMKSALVPWTCQAMNKQSERSRHAKPLQTACNKSSNMASIRASISMFPELDQPLCNPSLTGAPKPCAFVTRNIQAPSPPSPVLHVSRSTYCNIAESVAQMRFVSKEAARSPMVNL